MHVLTRPEAGFYGTHSVATDPGGGWSKLNVLTGDHAELATAVRNLVIHREGCQRYGFTLPAERRNEAETRYVSDILGVLDTLVETGLDAERQPPQRFAGTCRDFALLFAAALRHNGVPARLRSGYMTYAEPGFHSDHWVTEYWRPGRGWTLADVEFGGYDGIDFDPMDVPRDKFLVAGDAWLACRSGTADPETFGVRLPTLERTGRGMLIGSLLRDLAALNKVEVLPWDVWGIAELADGPDDAALALLDRVAELSSAGGAFDVLREAYEENPGLRITAPITSHTTYGGVRVVEIRDH